MDKRLQLNENIKSLLEPTIPHLFIYIPKYAFLNPQTGRQFGSAAFSEGHQTKPLS